MANGTPDTGSATNPGLPPGMTIDQFLGDRPGEAPAIQPQGSAQPGQPVPANPIWSGVERYAGAFGRGAAYSSPVAAGTLALGAATGPGMLAAAPAAAGELLVGGLGGVAEQAANDLGAPSWVGPTVGTVIGLGAGGLPAVATRAGAIAAGIGAFGHSAIGDIGRIASGDLLAQFIGQGGTVAHLMNVAPAAITATAAAGAYGIGAGALRVLQSLKGVPAEAWSAAAKPLAGYLGTGDPYTRAVAGGTQYVNSLSPGAVP